jgi:hypothetical protein
MRQTETREHDRYPKTDQSQSSKGALTAHSPTLFARVILSKVVTFPRFVWLADLTAGVPTAWSAKLDSNSAKSRSGKDVME